MSAGSNVLGPNNEQPYTISYHTGTKNSYIVEPKNGKANYEVAEIDPLKFYDELFDQPITLTKVSQGRKDNFKPKASLYDTETTQEESKKKLDAPHPDTLEVKTEVTIRSFAKAMDKLREKIAQKLMKSVDFTCIN